MGGTGLCVGGFRISSPIRQRIQSFRSCGEGWVSSWALLVGEERSREAQKQGVASTEAALTRYPQGVAWFRWDWIGCRPRNHFPHAYGGPLVGLFSLPGTTGGNICEGINGDQPNRRYAGRKRSRSRGLDQQSAVGCGWRMRCREVGMPSADPGPPSVRSGDTNSGSGTCVLADDWWTLARDVVFAILRDWQNGRDFQIISIECACKAWDHRSDSFWLDDDIEKTVQHRRESKQELGTQVVTDQT